MEENLNSNSQLPEQTTNSCGNGNKGRAAFNVILAIAVIVLYILHFTGSGKGSDNSNSDAKPATTTEAGALKVAYINTDTLNAKYEYIKDLEKELKAYTTAKENSYKQQMASFESDYKNFLKTGDQLTLSQQQAKEAELKKRAEKLSGLESELTMQIAQKQSQDQEKMVKAVYAFIREYNANNQQFNLILAKSGASSPVLYGDDSMDITDEIINGLNEEYASVKKNEKQADK